MTVWNGNATFGGSGGVSAGPAHFRPLLPDADSVDGTWTDSSGGTNLFAQVDEVIPSDSDYIKSGMVTLDTVKLSLANPSGATPTTPATVLYRYRGSSGDAIDLTVRLMQGSTEIASWTHTGISTSAFTTAEQTLTSPQFAAISDFTNLFLQFEAEPQHPSWLPLGTGYVAPTMYADFANNNYWLSSTDYAGSYSSWLSAMSGTFSRASTAYRVNSSGVWESIASGTERFDYDPLLLVPKGLLLEDAATNLFTDSNGQGGNWGGSSANVSWANAAGLDGVSTSARTVTNSGTSSELAYNFTAVTPDGTAYTLSAYFLWTSGLFPYLQIGSNDPSAMASAVFDPPNSRNPTQTILGSSGDYTLQNWDCVHVGNNWYRVFVTVKFTNAAKLAQWVIVGAMNAATGNTLNATNDITSSASGKAWRIWGLQLEHMQFPTAIIPTSGATATRAADSLGGTNLAWTNSSAFTRFVHSDIGGIYSGGIVSQTMVIRDTVGGSQTLGFYWSAGHSAELDPSSGTGFTFTQFFTDPLTRMKLVTAVNNSNRAAYLNGSQIGTDSNTGLPATANKWELGNNAGADKMQGHITEIGYFGSRLSNDDCQRFSWPGGLRQP